MKQTLYFFLFFALAFTACEDDLGESSFTDEEIQLRTQVCYHDVGDVGHIIVNNKCMGTVIVKEVQQDCIYLTEFTKANLPYKFGQQFRTQYLFTARRL